MKNVSIIAILIFIIKTSFAQQAINVPSYATNPQTMVWYKQQVKAWQKEIDRNEKDENAWHNLFKAKRLIVNHDSTDKRNTNDRDAELQEILTRMQAVIPNSYIANYCTWVFHGNDMKYYSYLQKAVAIDPDRKEHIDYMINIGEIERNLKQRDDFSLRKMESGQMSPGLLYYNFNTVIGLEKNAILLTSGDNDTYPVWALQAKGFRKDVKVVNRYLIHIKEYREKIFAEFGISNVTTNDDDSYRQFDENLISILSKNKNNYPVYAALSCAGSDVYTKNIEENLFLTGLTYAYKTTSFDNIAILRKNVETLFALDYLDKEFYEDFASVKVKDVNRNYIIPFLKLYQHYKDAGEMQKQQWIKEKLIFLSKGTDDEETVLKYLD